MRIARLFLFLLPFIAGGQPVSDVTMMVDLENVVWYYNEGTDAAKLLTSSSITPLPSNFVYALKNYVLFGDVVALNDKAAKGALAARGPALNVSTGLAPVSQRPIADINRNQLFDGLIEILAADGSQVGTLALLAFGAGGAPAGTPASAASGNFVVVGGAGAYAGAHGHGATASATNLRMASAVEDPAYRRINGGGKWRIAFTLKNMVRPEVAAAFHADFSPVTQAAPARSGETLILVVKGAGPTRPVLEPGKVFPADPLSRVASNVEAAVNGIAAEVINRVGWPGSNDLYRVDISLPGGLAPGTASCVLSVAWISSADYPLPVR